MSSGFVITQYPCDQAGDDILVEHDSETDEFFITAVDVALSECATATLSRAAAKGLANHLQTMVALTEKAGAR